MIHNQIDLISVHNILIRFFPQQRGKSRKNILLLDAIESDFSNFHIRFLLELTVVLGFSPQAKDIEHFVGERFPIVEQFMTMPFAESMLIPITGAIRNEIAEGVLRYIGFHTESSLNINSLKVLRELFS